MCWQKCWFKTQLQHVFQAVDLDFLAVPNFLKMFGIDKLSLTKFYVDMIIYFIRDRAIFSINGIDSDILEPCNESNMAQ